MDVTPRMTEQRVSGLLEAVMAVGSDLELSAVLRRIVETAVQLVDCEFGALGVVGEEYLSGTRGPASKTLVEFVTTGLGKTSALRSVTCPMATESSDC